MADFKGFKNCNIMTHKGIIKTSLISKEGIISKIGNYEEEGLLELDNKYTVLPGFIELHIHGVEGSDAMDATQDDLKKISNGLAKNGTTAFLATTMSQSKENIERSLRSIKSYIEKKNKNGAKMLGVHLEGPFLSQDHKGAQPGEYITAPNKEEYKRFEKASGNNIKLVSIAPENEGALDLIKYMKKQGTIASLAHTNASYEDCEKALEAGAQNITHTYNAQKAFHHRDVGIVGASLLIDEYYCEVICDGIHISPPAIQLLYKNKPKDKLILITDGMRATNLGNGEFDLGGQKVWVRNGEARLKDGTLAGSVLKMNMAVKNLMNFVNIPLEDAVKCATENPAKSLGIFDKMGSIEEGKAANFTVVDKDLNVFLTIRDGRCVYKRDSEERNPIVV
ncbi:MAG: N-acetylglucosamine-6-phosphate deacetylase [archaeon]|nr:N-acetylglucosamine-6-phosphate deacetylase [archaeon]